MTLSLGLVLFCAAAVLIYLGHSLSGRAEPAGPMGQFFGSEFAALAVTTLLAFGIALMMAAVFA